MVLTAVRDGGELDSQIVLLLMFGVDPAIREVLRCRKDVLRRCSGQSRLAVFGCTDVLIVVRAVRRLRLGGQVAVSSTSGMNRLVSRTVFV